MSEALRQRLVVRQFANASPAATEKSLKTEASSAFLTSFRSRVSKSSISDLNQLQDWLAQESPNLLAFDHKMCLAALKPLQTQAASEESRNLSFKFSCLSPSRNEAEIQPVTTMQKDENLLLHTPKSPIGTLDTNQPMNKKQILRLNLSSPRTEENINIQDLCDTEIYLLCATKAVYLTNLIRCHVFLGPINGSLLIRNMSFCQIHACARQVRIHDSNQCCFFLRTASGPIIENSTHLSFARYLLQYKTIEQDLRQSPGLQDEDSSKWKQIKDFGWLKTTPSPNFKIIDNHEVLVIDDQ